MWKFAVSINCNDTIKGKKKKVGNPKSSFGILKDLNEDLRFAVYSFLVLFFFTYFKKVCYKPEKKGTI